MSNILAVRVSTGNRLLFYRSDPYVVSLGDHVLIQVEGELQMGKVERVTPVVPPETSVADQMQTENACPPPDERTKGEVPASVPAIFRPATEEDLIRDRENRELARNALAHCRECIQERRMDMKLVEVEVLFDGSKIIFYFTAPNRIDFRDLVKELVRSYRTRIELRQIGARHETQMIGGLGNCGQLVCCQRFLRQFAPSTIKMAKEQNLFLNPAKISGVCNRLLCCLSFEQPNYDAFLNQCPKIGKRYATALGSVKVIRANYFRQTLSVFLEPGGEKEIPLEEWKQLVGAAKEVKPLSQSDKEPSGAKANQPTATVPPPAPAAPSDAPPAKASPPAARPKARKKSRRKGEPPRPTENKEAPQTKSKRRSRSSRRKGKTKTASPQKTEQG
jgi:cell fate regulator YaaT (PSP1 superfamily)